MLKILKILKISVFLSFDDSFFVEKKNDKWQVDHHEWHEIEVEWVIEPLCWGVQEGEVPWVSILILRVLTAFCSRQLSNCSFDWQFAHWSKVNLWQFSDHFEPNITGDQFLWWLSLSALHNVDPLGKHENRHVCKSNHKGKSRVSEFFWMTQWVFHHVHSRPKGTKVSEMQKKSGEEKGNLQWSASVEFEADFTVYQNSWDKEKLNGSNQHQFIKQVELVCLSHYEFMFIGLD